MKYDIVEAIKEYYKDDENTMTNCFLWLSTHNLLELVDISREELISMRKCPYCGKELQVYTWREYHPEVDPPMQFEEMSEMYCLDCDFN